jgi:hypothetical protein
MDSRLTQLHWAHRMTKYDIGLFTKETWSTPHCFLDMYKAPGRESRGNLEEDSGASCPLGYRRYKPRPKPKIGPYLEQIAQIIEEDKHLPKKQRHTSTRVYHRIRERGYEGEYTQVNEAVRETNEHRHHTFMPPVMHFPSISLNFRCTTGVLFLRRGPRPLCCMP